MISGAGIGSTALPVTILVTLLVTLLTVSCGNRLPPPGGPEDKEGPVLEECVPGQNEVGVDTASKISIMFDEKIDQESAVKAVTLSPAHEKVHLKVKGRRIELQPEGGLFQRTTYQVTIGNMLQDQRGNHFTGPYTFYFSTGDTMDTGVISGTVLYRGKGAGGAYVMAAALPESVNYTVHADSSGQYRLAHLPAGPFFLFSFMDQNGDGKYRFAVEPKDEKRVELLTEPVEVDFSIVVMDTSPPVLESVEPVDSMTLKLVFDDAMNIEPGPALPENFRVYPEKDSTALVPLSSVEPDSTAVEVMYLETAAALEDGERYWVVVTGLVNESGLTGRPLENRQKFAYYRR